jgi:cytochrome c-L|tara:strand:+ start:162 stop:731 length:570 start_codon:yes stop_codon:yes gene_type:complete
MLGKNTFKSTLVGGLLTIAGMAFSFQASAACDFVSTKDGSPLKIKVTAEDSDAAKTFLETCKNPYNEIFAKDAKALKKLGRRAYNYNNCTGCHGGKLEGVMAPGLRKQPEGGQSQWDNMWIYAKNATDKGMFETIAGGTPGKSAKGNMFIWHNQIEGHTGDGLTTDEILQAVAYVRTFYAGKDGKTWLK